MKKLRIIGLLLSLAVMACVCAANAQNGGQFNENPSVKMEFVSKIGNITTFKVTNKQNCNAEIQTKASSQECVKMYASMASDTVQLVGLVGTNVKIQSKALTNCGTTDYGNVELFLNINDLPVKFGRIKATLITSKRIK